MKTCRDVIGMDFADRIRRCLVAGFFNNAAKLHHTGVYKTVRENYTLRIYMGSALMVIYNEVLQDSMRDITVIEPEWLYELAPHFYEFGTI
uniref:DEAD-box helicase OB fold domain-containing protein n=1 Tax=Romanomermis culicivorax TaxID=13658 RepID=A0A915K2G2_ROMCU